MNQKSIFFSFLSVLVLLASCKSATTDNFTSDEGEPIPLSYSENLSLTKFPGYIKAEITNPWDTTKNLNTYLLVPDSLPLPENLPKGTVIRTPLKTSVVFPSVHNSLIAEFDGIDAIKGVCDAEYIYNKELSERIKNGIVADCGNSMSPNLEKIIKLKPDGILISPFENSGSHGKLGQLGIPIIECADYMESSPLGRAEWMKFYGMLYGAEENANSLFEKTEREYLDLKKLALDSSDHPKVLVDRLYGSSWNVPAKNSTMGVFIEDAGGINPFSYLDKNGSASLAGEKVLVKAGDADIWIVRYSQNKEMTLAELASDNQLYSQFKAFKDKNVYGCNTSKKYFFEEVPFHPQWFLADLISIFHPEIVIPGHTDRYFSKMN